MKKMICCLAITAIAILTVTAQEGERIFKKFKGDVSLGYAAPLGSDNNGGVLFAMEPKFALMDQLAVGLRIEGAVMAKFTGRDIYGNVNADDAKAAGSYLATLDYYFTNNYSFRPFAGGGVGVYGIIEDAVNSDQVTLNKFGGILRAGAEIKHFRIGIEYNFIPASQISTYTYDPQGMPMLGSVKSKNTYIGIKLGFCFGGGPL